MSGPPGPGTGGPGPEQRRLMLIDDSPTTPTILRALLSRAGRTGPAGQPGYAVDWVRTVEAGLTELRRDAHACYIVDYRVGPDSGIQLIRDARREGLLAPVIVLTGTNAVEHEAVEAGANDYLVKGEFDRAALERAIRYAIGNAEALRRAATLNTVLEERVSDRTRALTEANARLQEQIAARESAEAALVRAERMEALGRMTGTVAHDFNNVLTALVGSLDLLQDRLGPEADARLRRPLSTAVAATARGSSMVEGLLAFARQQPIAPRLLDVNEVVRTTSDLLHYSDHASAGLRFDLAQDLPPVLADRDGLERAIVNLATNARDAVAQAPDGWVLVETSRGGSGLLVPNDPSRVRITVRDNGTGMPPEVAARAFEPLFTTKGVGKGTGLGLAQVYGFARQSGGDAQISTIPGQGTAVSILLPAAV